MPWKEKKITKVYYTVGEVAAMFDVATSLLRFWEAELGFKIGKHRNGNRRYTHKDIEFISWIYYLVRTKGYTLWGVRKQMKLKNNHGNQDNSTTKARRPT